MENWAQQYEEKKDKIAENRLNDKLDQLSEIIDNINAGIDQYMLKILTEIVEIYDEMDREAYDFNEKDLLLRKKQLAELKYKILKKEHMNTKESQSWEEYEKEEKDIDDDLER